MPVYRTPNPHSRPASAGPVRAAPAGRDVEVISHSVEQTRRIGARLAALLSAGDLVLLEGPFGAGKTTFTQGLARGLGVDADYVNSPTFTLINEYTGRLPLYHVDLYRLETVAQAYDLGLGEYVDGEGVTVIEWPERAAALLPPDRLTIYLSDVTETKRALRFHAAGAHYVTLLERFKEQSFAHGSVPEGEAPPGGPSR